MQFLPLTIPSNSAILGHLKEYDNPMVFPIHVYLKKKLYNSLDASTTVSITCDFYALKGYKV